MVIVLVANCTSYISFNKHALYFRAAIAIQDDSIMVLLLLEYIVVISYGALLKLEAKTNTSVII